LSQLVLINEQNVVLEAGVQMGLESEVDDDWIVVAVDVGVDTVHTLKHLKDERTECLGERHT
jgi:hypothetical protein